MTSPDTARGSDGLTDGERAEYARRYREGAGRLTVSPSERVATQAWLAAKQQSALSTDAPS